MFNLSKMTSPFGTPAAAAPSKVPINRNNADKRSSTTNEAQPSMLCREVSTSKEQCSSPLITELSQSKPSQSASELKDFQNQPSNMGKEELPTVSPQVSKALSTRVEPGEIKAKPAEQTIITSSEQPQQPETTNAVSSDSSTNEPAEREATEAKKKNNVPRRRAGLPSAKDTRTMGSSLFPRPCLAHSPTLEELRQFSFSDYVRDVVLYEALPKFEDSENEDDFEEEDWCTSHMPLTEGIGKVSLPDGFWGEEGIAMDRTGRGPQWQKGQSLGDFMLQSPITQHIRGMAGVYEYTFTDNPAISMAEFRERADKYRDGQIGSAHDTEEDAMSDERMTQLDRQFWKRLGPTMPPSWYGADQEGTFFGEDPASGWNVGELDSCLHVLSRVPGVTTPYLYAGMWASVFCAHTEDMNLLSINYLHAGAPKIWYAIAPGPDAKRFEALCEFQYPIQARGCKEFMRHKRCILSPTILNKAGIKYTTAIQRPGDAIITFPGGYHFGFNTGFNMAEATNFGVPEWIPYGLSANICLCRPDSVRIDMKRLISLLDMFESDRGRKPKLTWKEWSRKREEKKERKRARSSAKQDDNNAQVQEPAKSNKSKKKKISLSDQQRKNEFWVEVMKPAPKISASKVKKPKVVVEEEGRGKRKRKPTLKAAQWESEIKQEEEPIIVHQEIWHLAKPIGRKPIDVGARVLCLLPGTVMRSANPTEDDDGNGSDQEEDEQCFAGQAIEVADNHIRIRLNGCTKADDVWLPLEQEKVYFDGGSWSDQEQFEMPKLHYWKVMDSKRRCGAS